ncbi:MAG: DUF1499 domain-containing protein [Xanthomonadales bacterium]|nr:DUF1499 domain-containing protein [Xanthomonadales bacterium]
MKALRVIVVAIAVVAALLLLVAGPGTRLAWWDFGFGFTLMRWALYGGVAAGGLAVLMLLIPATRRGGVAALLAAVVIGLGTAALPYSLVQKARSVPPIHDITTDMANPPEFVAIAPLRAEAPNPVEYAGEETAAQQREAYPEIKTLHIDAWPAIVFEHALETAQARGWEIVEADESKGRIEATATTFWFGFKDDVVIRLRGDNNGTAVDMRSKSRVGRSDVGANAARIEAFLEDLETRIQS